MLRGAALAEVTQEQEKTAEGKKKAGTQLQQNMSYRPNIDMLENPENDDQRAEGSDGDENDFGDYGSESEIEDDVA